MFRYCHSLNIKLNMQVTVILFCLHVIEGLANSELIKMTSELKTVKEVQTVADGNSLFSAQLQEALKKSNPANLIFSPFSVSTVSAMLKLGTRGKTAEEMAKAFNFPSSDESLGRGYSQVLASLKKSDDGYTLSAANRLYCKIGFELKQDYSQAIQKSFDTEVEQIDFEKNSPAAKKINDWVSKMTNDKIKNLISPDILNKDTSVVLVNGVYFKGFWKDKFEPKHTSKAKFNVNDKESVEVDMMFKRAKFPYVDLGDMDAHAVALPYKGDRLSMIIYLPKQNNGLPKLEAGLKNLTPAKILEKMDTFAFIEFSLPRFKIESTMSLMEPLKKLGIQTLFSNAADLSGIPKSAVPLSVSAVVQKAYIEVNEEGSEAAAATGMVAMARSLPRTIRFNADHPFLYQIVDSLSNFILFAGCYAKP